MDSELNFNLVKEYIETVITPNFKIDISQYGFTQDSCKLRGHFSFPSRFQDYSKTDYYYANNSHTFIHFTSLDTFFHIVNNGHFLATQFTNHDDPLELLYAHKQLSQVSTSQKLERLKSLIFSLSMCTYEADTDSFPMWRLYGNNGYGIGIVFSFYPNVENWNNSFLSSIYYGNEKNALQKFEKFSVDHQIFLQTHPNFLLKSNIGEIGISDSIALFLAFHKNAIFSEESEVRFLKSFLSEGVDFDRSAATGLKFDKKNNLHYTYRIPIVSENNIAIIAQKKNLPLINNFQTRFSLDNGIIKDYIENTPFIIIEKIILGYRYTEFDLNKLNRNLSFINRKINCKEINAERSILSDKFYGL